MKISGDTLQLVSDNIDIIQYSLMMWLIDNQYEERIALTADEQYIEIVRPNLSSEDIKLFSTVEMYCNGDLRLTRPYLNNRVGSYKLYDIIIGVL